MLRSGLPLQQRQPDIVGDRAQHRQMLVDLVSLARAGDRDNAVERGPEPGGRIRRVHRERDVLRRVREPFGQRVRYPDAVGATREHVGESIVVTHAACDGESFVAQCEARLPVARIARLGGERGQEAGPVGRVVWTDGLERRLQHLDALLVDRAGRARPATGVGERGAHEELRGIELAGQGGGGQQHVAVRSVARVTLRDAEVDEQRAPPMGIALGPGVEQLERFPEPVHAVLRCQVVHRALAGHRGVVDRFITRRIRRGPLVGQFADAFHGVGAEERGERLGNPPVGAPTPGRRQLVVQGVLDERVDEAESFHPAGNGIHQQGSRRRVEGIEGGVVGRSRHGDEEVEVELASDHRREAEDSLHVGSEVRDPPAHDVAHRHRQADLAQITGRRPAARGVATDRTCLREVSEGLGREEWVAVGLGQEHVA